ncbi:mCG1028426, partial [Mus musculus]
EEDDHVPHEPQGSLLLWGASETMPGGPLKMCRFYLLLACESTHMQICAPGSTVVRIWQAEDNCCEVLNPQYRIQGRGPTSSAGSTGCWTITVLGHLHTLPCHHGSRSSPHAIWQSRFSAIGTGCPGSPYYT